MITKSANSFCWMTRCWSLNYFLDSWQILCRTTFSEWGSSSSCFSATLFFVEPSSWYLGSPEMSTHCSIEKCLRDDYPVKMENSLNHVTLLQAEWDCIARSIMFSYTYRDRPRSHPLEKWMTSLFTMLGVISWNYCCRRIFETYRLSNHVAWHQ